MGEGCRASAQGQGGPSASNRLDSSNKKSGEVQKCNVVRNVPFKAIAAASISFSTLHIFTSLQSRYTTFADTDRKFDSSRINLAFTQWYADCPLSHPLVERPPCSSILEIHVYGLANRPFFRHKHPRNGERMPNMQS